MTNLADQLPTDIAQQLHPDHRKIEARYWTARDQILPQFDGLWVGFANGQVIASEISPVAVFYAAETSGRHPFVVCVGKEDVLTGINRFTPVQN
jgi:hypothetical protein